MDQITAIQKSLTAFICGILGFLPVIGLVPATYAIATWMKVRGEYHDWNPAAPYLNGGAALGFISLLFSMTAATLIVISIIQSSAGFFSTL
jgi:hypothetical protein